MTIKDIAKLAQVSAATVSRVMNNEPNVSEKSKEKVLKVVNETGFVLNTVGRNLRKSKSEMLLVILPTLSNPFYSKILKGIEEQAGKKGYGVLVSVTHLEQALERKYLNLLPMKQVDGVISFHSNLSVDDLTGLGEKYPIVQVCEYTEGAKVPYVKIDNYKAAYEVTKHFIANGHKHIGMISGSFYTSSEYAREEGLKKALQEAGLTFDDQYIVKSNYKAEDGIEKCKQLLSLPKPPTAILTVSDMLAIGAINHLEHIGIEVGKEIEVIGFDNNSITKVYSPTVSTVSQPRYDLGTVSVDLIFEKINNLGCVNKGIILPYELLFRESTIKKSNQ